MEKAAPPLFIFYTFYKGRLFIRFTFYVFITFTLFIISLLFCYWEKPSEVDPCMQPVDGILCMWDFFLWLEPNVFLVTCGPGRGVSTILQPVIICVSNECFTRSGPL